MVCVCRPLGIRKQTGSGSRVYGLWFNIPCEEAHSCAQGGEVSSSSSLFLLYNDMTVCFHCGTVFFVDVVNLSCFMVPDVWRAMLKLTHRKRALWHFSDVSAGRHTASPSFRISKHLRGAGHGTPSTGGKCCWRCSARSNRTQANKWGILLLTFL